MNQLYTLHFDGIDLISIASAHESSATLAEELAGVLDVSERLAASLAKVCVLANTDSLRAGKLIATIPESIRRQITYQLDHAF